MTLLGVAIEQRKDGVPWWPEPHVVRCRDDIERKTRERDEEKERERRRDEERE